MALAGGVGVNIAGGGLAIPAKYSRVQAQVQPLSGTGVVTIGTYDQNGNYLHVQYQGNLNLGARSNGNQTKDAVFPDFVPNKIVVEFDAQSEFVLPFEGHIYLVGGFGEYKFGLQVTDIVDARYYRADMRFLRTVFNGRGVDGSGNSFTTPNQITIPDFHTFILGTNTADQYVLPDGSVLQPGIIMPGAPIIPGITINAGGKASNVLTGWRG